MVMAWLNVPLVPLTVTVYDPLLVPVGTVIVSVDVPDVWIGFLLKLVVQPVGALVESVTCPVNPLSAVTVMVEVPEEPLLTRR